jgi:putative membrane protein
MKTPYIALLSAGTLALAACGQKTTTTENTSATTTNTEMTTATTVAPSAGQTFANTAAASDAFEIATSQMALTKSTSASVKKFAQKMIDAHTQSTAKLTTAVSGLTPPIAPDATLSATQQQTVDSLKSKSGADFDSAYIAAQTAGHQQTVDALKSYAATGDVPALKTFASNLVPIVTAHLNMAKGLKA